MILFRRRTINRLVWILYLLFILILLKISFNLVISEGDKSIQEVINHPDFIINKEKYCNSNCLSVDFRLVPEEKVYSLNDKFRFSIIFYNPRDEVFEDFIKITSEPNTLLSPYEEGREIKLRIEPKQFKEFPSKKETEEFPQIYIFSKEGLNSITLRSRADKGIEFLSLKDPRVVDHGVVTFSFEVISSWEKTKADEFDKFNQQIKYLTIITVILALISIVISLLSLKYKD